MSHAGTTDVPFLSLIPGPDSADVRAAVERVIARGWFVLGPEVEAFEHEFAAACHATHTVGVGTGTDGLALALRALGIGPGDEVITTPLSAAFSALAIMMAGAVPVFADIDPERLTIDPAALESAITSRTSAIMPVHLYGQPADMPTIEAIAQRHGLALLEDACQAHLATSAGRPVGSFGAAAVFSFYPTKNLGAIGDGGAVTTRDASLADRLRRLRNGGQTEKYRHAEFGVNTRLDEVQAAVLRARLPYLAAWTERRRALAARYRHALQNTSISVPRECDPGHVYHLFPILTGDRTGFRAHLTQHGVGTEVHYPNPIPRQGMCADLPHRPCPNTDRVCASVCSLPLHPRLSDADVDRVAAAIHSWRGAPLSTS